MGKYFILAFFALSVVLSFCAVFLEKEEKSIKFIKRYKFLGMLFLGLTVLLSVENFANVFGKYDPLLLCLAVFFGAFGTIYFSGWLWHRKKYYDSFEAGDLGIFYPEKECEERVQYDTLSYVKGHFVKANGRVLKLKVFDINDTYSKDCKYLMMLSVNSSGKFAIPVRRLQMTMRLTEKNDMYRVYGVLLDESKELIEAEFYKDDLREDISDKDFLEVLVSTKALRYRNKQAVCPV